MTAAGALSLLALGVAILAAAVVVWKRPALALPIFALGFALHSAVLMWLIHSGVPVVGVRLVQAWKEELLALLALRVMDQVIHSGGRAYVASQVAAWHRGPRLIRTLDVISLSFGLLLLVYVVMPSGLLGDNGPGLGQRLVAFRAFALIPALYFCGRFWPPLTDVNWRWVAAGVVGVAAGVAVLGLIELWFIPTRTWVSWGIIQFDEFLGFHYGGPGGLPENFFQSTTGGLALRRMVSTYLSPLGVAYTALLVIPVAMALAAWPGKIRRRWVWFAMSLIVLSLAMSITRLALLCGAAEAVVLAILLRKRVVFVASGAIVAAMLLAMLVYPNYGPIVAWDLSDLRPPAGTQLFRSSDQGSSSPGSTTPGTDNGAADNVAADIVARAVSGQDESMVGHLQSLKAGAEFVVEHPLGVGLGGAVPRYGNGNATAPGESALLQMGEEMGWLGFILFALLYGLLTLVGLIRAFFEPIDRPGAALSLILGVGGLILAPIVVTSQVWGDFSVTFFFWWIAGSAVTAWSANPWKWKGLRKTVAEDGAGPA